MPRDQLRLILSVLLSSAYSSKNYDQYEIEKKERRIAGGGNYGGFIGLTTYGAGPFLVKGKYEKIYNDDNAKDVKEGFLNNDDKSYSLKYIGDEGYKDTQKDQYYVNRPVKDEDKKDDQNLEYLGYRGPRYCIGENRDKYRYDNKFRIENRQNRDNEDFSNYFDDEIKDRCDKFFGFTGPTANDEPENLIRPCALDDWQCIRKYFAANSNCKSAYGPIPDPLYVDINTIFIPIVNLTVALPNMIVRGLSSAKIREFYVNKKSGNLVLALDVTNLNQTIPRAYFRYRRTAKESIVLADYATINLSALTLTAVIPNVPHLRLDLADIHADVQDGTPFFFIGPGAANSTDPDVVTAFAQLIPLLPISLREGFLFESQLLTSIYIQKNICDFGLKLISV